MNRSASSGSLTLGAPLRSDSSELGGTDPEDSLPLLVGPGLPAAVSVHPTATAIITEAVAVATNTDPNLLTDPHPHPRP